MDEQRMQRFKTLLEVRQRELLLSIEHQLQAARIAESQPDALDQATSGYEKESSFHRSNKEQQLLEMVNSALGRIQNRAYGMCQSCSKEINGKRLEAVPWTPYCVECQENFER